MNERKYTIPGLKDVIVKTSDTECGIWFGLKGQGFVLNPVWPAQEIANRVKSVLWFDFSASEKVKNAAHKAALRVDWQAIKSQAGTDVQHTSPSLPSWTLKISDANAVLLHSDGASVRLTADTPMPEIIEGVRRVLQPISTSQEIDAVVQTFSQIDFKRLISSAWVTKFAPLIDDFESDNSALVASICEDVRMLAVLQKSDNTALVEMIHALVNELTA